MITRCGYAAIVGRPNVGKSTLLNSFLGQKVSITSRKPQTTRHKLLGIKTLALHQILFVDTPGIHLNEPKAINRYMNKSAKSVFRDVDVCWVLFRHAAFCGRGSRSVQYHQGAEGWDSYHDRRAGAMG